MELIKAFGEETIGCLDLDLVIIGWTNGVEIGLGCGNRTEKAGNWLIVNEKIGKTIDGEGRLAHVSLETVGDCAWTGNCATWGHLKELEIEENDSKKAVENPCDWKGGDKEEKEEEEENRVG